jgi:hypothetical protein
VQGFVLNFLKECVDAGADGFRFDMAKSIETPKDDASFASDFWPTVVGGVQEYAGGDLYIYGEILDDAKIAISAYTEYMSVTDNGWGNHMRTLVASGTAALAEGFYKSAPASNLVIWAESHDTYATDDANQSSAGVSEQDIHKTWALIAARADIMGLYFARPESMSQALGVASVTGWDNPEVRAANLFRNAFAGQAESLSKENGICYVERGTSGVVLVNTVGGKKDVTVTAKAMADGTYTDQITGAVFTVANGKISGTIGDTGIAVVYNAAEDPEYTINWVEAYSSLGGNIAVVFKTELSEDLANDPNAFMHFTYANKTIDIPVSEAVKSGKYHNFYCRITSVNMTDDITAQMMVGDEAVGESRTTSLEKYCSYILSTSKDAKTVDLMKAMLNYGAAAQKMIGYKTDNLANKNLSDADKVLTAVDASGFKHNLTGAEDGIKAAEALLVLNSETTIRIGFQLTGSKTIDEYTFTVDGVEVRPEYKGGMYVLEVKNIAAHKLDEYHTFTCGDITITYCGLSYVNQIMKNYTEGTTFDMAVALYNYSQATEAFIA